MVFIVVAGGLEENFLVVRAHQFDARARMAAAADEKRRPRMRDLERHRSQRALRLVAAQFRKPPIQYSP